ncbi:hypothetical protein BX616_005675 [Lobosporangium transversale]|nr:hypothetical protein BX616_005675 [Lobosporangium transversale]
MSPGGAKVHLRRTNHRGLDATTYLQEYVLRDGYKRMDSDYNTQEDASQLWGCEAKYIKQQNRAVPEGANRPVEDIEINMSALRGNIRSLTVRSNSSSFKEEPSRSTNGTAKELELKGSRRPPTSFFR